MKHKFSIFLIIYSLTVIGKINSQTSISPFIGYDFQRVITKSDYILDLSKKGYSYHSPLIGFRLKQRLFKPIYFGLLAEYSFKKVGGYYNHSFPQDLLISYQYFRNSIELKYFWRDNFYFGTGLMLNVVRNFSLKDQDHPTWIYKSLINYYEFGYSFLIGVNYKKFNFEIFYLHRQSYKTKETVYIFALMDGIDNMGIRLGYEIKLFNGFRKKKGTECPDFKS